VARASAAGIDDVGFMAAILDRLEANLCVDRRRVYAAGMSNGAIMSHVWLATPPHASAPWARSPAR